MVTEQRGRAKRIGELKAYGLNHRQLSVPLPGQALDAGEGRVAEYGSVAVGCVPVRIGRFGVVVAEITSANTHASTCTLAGTGPSPSRSV